ncbi:MAG: ribonuclease-3 [Cognaticolwellia sp.]|jgi:ribonuclease-3
MSASTKLGALAEKLGLDPAAWETRDHFAAALSRRAWNLENGQPNAPHHESLEWLGDRILGALVATELWRRFPGAEPGRLDLSRDSLTSASALAEVGRELDLLSIIRMGKGEKLQGQVDKDKAISDHVEAIIGAVFLVEGWEGANALVIRLLSGRFPDGLPKKGTRLEGETGSKAMTALSSLVQRKFKRNLAAGDWKVERLGGPDNAPLHVASVTLPDKTTHDGPSVTGPKKMAKAQAAIVALDYLRAQDPNKP